MAVATAPVKSVAPLRKREPKSYIFRLGEKWLTEYKKREDPHCGRLMLPMQDDIYWPYYENENKELVPAGIDENILGKVVEFLPRTIRFVSGAKSIFMDEQEKTGVYALNAKGENRLLENPSNRDKLMFNNGELHVQANDKVLKNYLHCRNDCKNQNPKANDHGRRAKMINPEFELLDFGHQDFTAVELGQKKEDAYSLAKTARDPEMIPHARFLNIPFVHDGSNEPKSDERIKQDYIDFAYNNPIKFLDTFNDPRIKVLYKIKTLIETQEITLNKVVGQAHWVKTEGFIVQIPQDQEPVTFLSEFALSKQGEEFMTNLRSFK